MSARTLVAVALFSLMVGSAQAKKVFLNPSNQFSNPVAGGGNEAQYALINANLAKGILVAAGVTATVDQDFYNAPKNANSWGADIFISIHTNAGGGHGIETLYVSSGGKVVAGKVQNGLLATLPYESRGLKPRSDLHVLNATSMYACLTEALFHDCSKTSGYQGHPPSEAAFLKSADGQKKIAAGIAAGACAYFGATCGGAAPPPPPAVTKGWLKGKVYKAPDLAQVIAGATVKLSSGQTLKSDASGLWSIELVPAAITVTVSATGYKIGTAKVTLTAGKEIWASVGLVPETEPKPASDGGPEAPAEEGGVVHLWPDLGSKGNVGVF